MPTAPTRTITGWSGVQAIVTQENLDSQLSDIAPTFDAKTTTIYIWNVAPLGWEEQRDQIRRPPVFPHLFIPACPKEKEYVLVGTIEHPFAQTAYDNEGKPNGIRYSNGYIEATRLLSPMNPGLDQDWKTSDDAYANGDNLNEFGLFWSTNQVKVGDKLVGAPKPEEIAAARKRMEARFRWELARMAKNEASDPQNCHQLANRISHAAAEYFEQSFVWHRRDFDKKDAGKVDCWACGEKIQPKALLCIHCRAPQEEDKRETFINALTGSVSPNRKKAVEAAA